MMEEHSIPIMVDVEAETRGDAAYALSRILRRLGLNGDRHRDDEGETIARVEAWWMIEAQDKDVDRNDRDAGRVVFDEPAGWLVRWPWTDGERTLFTTDVDEAAEAANEHAGAVLSAVYLAPVT